MGAFVIYILEWSACLLAFMFLYKMCFSGTTFHRFNRFYLLGTVVLSAILPLIHIIPSGQIEPIAETCRAVVSVDKSTLNSININPRLEADTGSFTTLERGTLILLATYTLYVLIQLTGWTKSIVKMLRFIRGKRRHRLGKWVWLVEHDADYGPFSWMNCIVISSHEQGFGRKASMLHELSHITLLHHLDLVFLMACVIINPTCWMVMKEIKVVHEYEADDEVINHYKIQSRDYQRLLIMRTVGAEAYALASSFNLNIKKRIIMMKKKQSHWWRMIWIAVTVPLIGFALMAFSKPKEALREAVDNTVMKVEQPITEVLRSDIPITENDEATAELPETAQADTPLPPDLKPGDIITGTVKDENGQPIVNANLVEEDEYHRIVAHTVTDKNGKFSFKAVNPKHKIRISYVGYASKTLDISKQIDVALEPNTLFQDIKVIGKVDSIDYDNPRYHDKTNQNESDDVFNLIEQAPVFPGGAGWNI